MKIQETPIKGVFSIESDIHSDHRGGFLRLFCDKELDMILEHRQIVQINQSITHKKGCIRGLHFQHPPHAEMKFIRCLKGKVFDVAIDLRRESDTFLMWYAQILSSEKKNMQVIPEGCAHGFQTLEDNSELLYFHTTHYEPSYEAGILFNDPTLEINWPIKYTDISTRDKQHPQISKNFSGIVL